MNSNRFFLLTTRVIVVIALALGISCGDKLDIPDKPLAGKVAGQDWEYEFMSSSQYGQTTGGFKYTLRFHSSEDVTNNCATISTKPHLSVIMPVQVGSYSLPLAVNSETLVFDYGNGTKFQATSGFIEIFARDEFTGKIAGYIQAISDENNSVEGQFIANLCF